MADRALVATLFNWIAYPFLILFVLCREAWRATARTLKL
jgi:hypothetical protein